jgi:segregation and condensation protein A
MSFEVKIPLFEGPFDLLLFFIRRDELDIHDIPIAKITDDFLDYLRQLERLNMEVASEFILVAATLMRIKAKMLLPRVELDEAGQEIDPREELVRHLLEYKKYKSVLGELEVWEDGMMRREARGNALAESRRLAALTDVEAELQDVGLFELFSAFRKAMRRFEQEQARPVHQVVPYPYTISAQRDFLLARLRLQERLSFEQVVALQPHRIAVIFNFLAILELMQLEQIAIQVGEGFNNFWISLAAPEPAQ